jgi:cytochrome P450
MKTSASALCWALYLLALDSEWRKRLESEVDRELPDGGYIDGSLDRLVMTRAVIEETLRLYPPIATIHRQAVATDRLGSHQIKPGTFVIIAPYVLHRHRLLWEAPDLFDPSRFLPGVRKQIDRYAYLPFGAGARACIGGALALRTLIITLATIVRAFRLELVADYKIFPVLALRCVPIARYR